MDGIRLDWRWLALGWWGVLVSCSQVGRDEDCLPAPIISPSITPTTLLPSLSAIDDPLRPVRRLLLAGRGGVEGSRGRRRVVE